MLQLESSWHGRSVDHVCIPNDKSLSDLRNLHELRGKRLVAQSSWHGRSVDHVLTYSGRQIALGSQKLHALRGKRLIEQEHGSCLNLIRMKNHGGISETFTNYDAKDLLHKSVDHVLTYSGRQITIGSQKPSRMTRQKTCCASESNTSVCVVFANHGGFDAPIGVVLAWKERGSCLNIFQITNRVSGFDAPIGVVLLLQLESSWHGRSVDHVLTILDNKSLSDLRNLHELRGKRPVAHERGSCLNIFRMTNHYWISETFTNYEVKDLLRSESKTSSIRVVFPNRSGFDAPIGVVLAWEKRGSCLNIFRTKNHARISETFMNYEAKDLLRNESNTSVCVVFANHGGFDAPIGVVLPWEERGSCLNIFRTKNHDRISETITNYEAKDLLHNVSNTSVRIVFANWSGFDAPIGVVLALEERGSYLNIFRTKNHDRISETITNYEAKDLLRNQSNTSVRVVFANRSGFDAPIGVVLAWEERGSCINILRMKNRGQISETFSNYEAKTCCATESNTSVRVVFANRSGFDAPIGVVMAWE
ncbi:uncharacterized protein G2W53_014354 [Senna tora]|uniref:Uncharacterized protein n=1 Tax=Senna tora TaxID=362788 RepID=A0A835C6A1_9FABA|nr:uncharacterized protein G2W53_014354 [Senna tora]